jgi:uncharacterized repeat protein (TIGR01451 family)
MVVDDAFGSGDFTNSIEDITAPAMTFVDTTGGTLDDHDAVAPDFQFQWRDGAAADDDTETVSLYHFVACGFIDLNNNDVFDSGVDLPDVIVETFRVVLPHTTLTKTPDSDKVVAGATITYTVREENDGFVPLNEPTLVDSLGIAFVRQPDDPGNNDNILEPGETWVYTGTLATDLDDCGVLENTVTSSTTVAGSGFPAEDEVASASATVICPNIDIVKTPDADKVLGGTDVTYTYTVTNTGDVELTNISVDDDVYGHICDIPSLAPGDSTSCTHTAAINADVTNIGTAIGNHQLGTVSDSDDAFVNSINPDISLTKTPAQDKVLAGTEVTYTFEVCNTGDVDLNNVNVDDSNLGHILGPISLVAGECAAGSASEVLNADKTNIATATGDHQLGTVSADATVTVRVINPSIDLTKEADTDTAVPGDTITYTWMLVNTGDVEISNPVVTDSHFGDLGAPDSGDNDTDGVLDVGETWTWEKTREVTDADCGELTNEANATGRSQLNEVTAGPVSVSVEVQCVFEGLTPGFWKANAENWDAVAWVAESPDDKFSDAFGVVITVRVGGTLVTDPTLLEALKAQGGVNEGKGVYDALARHCVAAKLNSEHPDITYPMSTSEIIDACFEAITNADLTDAEPLKDQLDEFNNLGGGIDQHGNPL